MPRCPICHHRFASGGRCPDDGWEAPEEAPPSIAHDETPALKGYGLVRLLGAGGHATVWEAVRSTEPAAVALKVGRSDGGMLVERFRSEAEALLRIGPPHAPRLHEHGKLDDGRPFLVMERLRGATLAAWLEACAAPPELDRALAVADAVLGAVEAAHARGVVHRDLKPENVFVDEAAGCAVLVDFGLARSAAPADGRPTTPPLTRPGTAAGTLEYVSPEQLRGDPQQDARADVYSLGAILYEVLTLRPPFAGTATEVEYGHLALRPQRPGEVARVPEAIERIVLDCLAKDPARRPQSVAALRRALATARSAPSEVETADDGRADAPAGARGGTAARGPMIAEGRRPVVVLVVETASPVAAMAGAVTARRGLVVRQRGRRYVTVFSGSETDAPIEAALGAARELCAHPGARAALHLAPVTLRPRPDGPPAAHGTAVDRPETWLPKSGWDGVWTSPEIARAAPSLTADRSAPPLDVPLLGRDDALATLDASAARARAGRPALVTVIGDHGLGKSRLAAEAAARFRAAAPDAAVIAVRAEQPAAGDEERTARELLAQLTGAAADVPAHRVDRARTLAAALSSRAREAPVAVVLDDAQWADDATLDALELATLQGPGRLLVVVAAHPRFEDARRGFGTRAEHAVRVALGPLAEAAGMQLAAALLAPAEYPPAAALAELHAWAGGNPATLAELARALKEAGLVRQRAAAGSFYLATAELHRLPASPAWQWLAARKLDAMPAELSACVRLCAVLGAGLSRDEIERVQASLERRGAASTPIDAGVALRSLAQYGVVTSLDGERFVLASAALRDAVLAMMDSAHRARIHEAALELWRGRVAASPGLPDVEALERLARHAEATGARDEAAAAYFALAERDRERHRHVAADARYTSALQNLADTDLGARARALSGRGKVRYRLYRTAEARADLEEACALARSLGDGALLADVALEQATVLDWEEDFAASHERTLTARALLESHADPRLAVRLLVAEGRSSWRFGRVAEAVAQLEQGAAAAKAAGDHDSRVVALLLLSCALVVEGRLEDAEARSDEAIALAASARDNVHLSAAYSNRFFLWSVRKDLAHAAEDMRRAMELAREAGNPFPERGATINLAELLFWCGRDDESVELARRSVSLEERFMPRPVHVSSLVLARVHAARDEIAEAARFAAWIDERCPPDATAPNARVLLGAVRLVVEGGGAAEAWDALLAESDALVPVERLELLHLRARAAVASGRAAEAARAFAEAEALFDESPDFRRRFAALGLLRGAGG